MGTGDDIFTQIPQIFLNTDALPMPKGDRKNLRERKGPAGISEICEISVSV